MARRLTWDRVALQQIGTVADYLDETYNKAVAEQFVKNIYEKADDFSV